MKCNHVVFLEDFIKIFVPRNKTDVYREGNFVYIARHILSIAQSLFWLST